MSARFWILASLYHLIVGGLSVWIGWGWTRASAGSSLAGLALRVAGGFALIGSLALPLALFLGAQIQDWRFASIRLLAQSLFGEGVLLAVWLTWTLARCGRARLALLPAASTVMLLAVYAEAYHHGPHDLRIERHLVDLAGTREDASLRVLHLSDLQVCEVGDYERRVVREALALEPDLILMTGDYVHPRLTNDRARLNAELRGLLRAERFGAPLGVFAVGGDTDGGNEHLFDGLGIHWLADESATVALPDGRRLVIVGLTRSRSRLRHPQGPLPVVQAAPRGDLRIVLGHGPDYVMELAGRTEVDLALAGHSHGGQIVLPLLGPPLTLTTLPRRYAAGGLTEYRGIPLHVSRGVGMERGSAPQVRFLCPPEICLLMIRY
jgi:predicted MPP superfamily phosphohydrolase